MEHIKKEMTEFEKQKTEELRRLQDFKNEETRKLKRERKQFEQYQKAMRALPDKRDRRDMEELRAQVYLHPSLIQTTNFQDGDMQVDSLIVCS